jgi:hypothetical protein
LSPIPTLGKIKRIKTDPNISTEFNIEDEAINLEMSKFMLYKNIITKITAKDNIYLIFIFFLPTISRIPNIANDTSKRTNDSII